MHLIQLWLAAPAQAENRIISKHKGVPQGSPLSPMLANLYLDHLDETLLDDNKKLVRYADDFLVLCKSRKAAENALELTEEVLHSLRLRINRTKTRVVDFDQGFRFLGVQFIRSLVFKSKPGPESFCSHPQDISPVVSIENSEHPLEPEPMLPDPVEPNHSLDPRLRTLYLLKHNQVLGKKSERLVVHQEGHLKQEIPAIKVDQIMVFGNAQITTQAMHFCLQERIPIYLLSGKGRFYGVVDSFDTDPVLLQKAQFKKSDDPDFCLKLAQSILIGKISNSRTLLQRLARNRPSEKLNEAAQSLKRSLQHMAEAKDLDQARGFEGSAARTYFQAIQTLVDPAWQFSGRNRMPPRDPINALLSYGYTLLFYNVYSFIRARGLNPQVGYLHPLRVGHPALVSDLVEEFRALVVDPVVWNLVLNKKLSVDQFTTNSTSDQGCRINKLARTRFIHEMEKKLNAPIIHPVSGLKLDYRRCIEHQINQLAAVIRDVRPAYQAMAIR